MLSEKTGKPETKEIYIAYRQNVNRYFEEVEKNVTQCTEAVSHLQQEFVLACKNARFHKESRSSRGLQSHVI
ncbi:MAG: hypothetical protein ACYC6W_12060 [Nitrosotalea sp.]